MSSVPNNKLIIKFSFTDDQISINLNRTDKLTDTDTDSSIKTESHKKKSKKSRKRCAPPSSTESGDDSSSSSSSDNRRKRATKMAKLKEVKYDIDIIISLRYDDNVEPNKKPPFPRQMTAEFPRGFQKVESFYDQLKLTTQVHVLTSTEFTKLATNHNITLSAPQFKYQVDKSGVMDEVPYPINEFFKRNCRDPYLITAKGTQSKAIVEISFHCSIRHVKDIKTMTTNEQWVVSRLRSIAEEYLDTPMHITSHRLSSMLNQFMAKEQVNQIKQRTVHHNNSHTKNNNNYNNNQLSTSPIKGYHTNSYRSPPRCQRQDRRPTQEDRNQQHY